MSPQKDTSTGALWAVVIIVIAIVFVISSGIIVVASWPQPKPPPGVMVTFPARSLSDQQAGAGGSGQAVFEQNCVGCHTIGGGDMVGPDLQGVTELRDTEWLSRWLLEPDKMLAEGDPIAAELLQNYNNVPMPNQGLSQDDVAAIIAYLANSAGDAASVQDASTQSTGIALEGNSTRGEALFTGATHLQNGAPACIACHSSSDVGVLGGGTLGPDLTHVFNRYGETGLAATLQSLPFPTMQGMYDDNPLTENESADLYAYFTMADQSTARSAANNIVLLGLAGFVLLGLTGFVLLLLISQFIWRNRVTEIRKPLLGETQ